MQKSAIVTITLMLVFLSASVATATEKQVVAGAGPSTKIVQSFFAEFSTQPEAQGLSFVIPPKSTKHAGGIKCSDYNLFGRTGRPLNTKEKQMNKGEIFLARVPIAFVIGEGAGVKTLSITDLENIYTKKITNWKDLGGADATIVLVGREPTEALFMELKAAYGFFKGAEFDQKFNKDNHIVNFMQAPQSQYALAFGAKPNFTELNIVKVDNFSTGARLGLVYDLKNKDNVVIKAAAKFAKSSEWESTVVKMGMFTVN